MRWWTASARQGWTVAAAVTRLRGRGSWPLSSKAAERTRPVFARVRERAAAVGDGDGGGPVRALAHSGSRVDVASAAAPAAYAASDTTADAAEEDPAEADAAEEDPAGTPARSVSLPELLAGPLPEPPPPTHRLFVAADEDAAFVVRVTESHSNVAEIPAYISQLPGGSSEEHIDVSPERRIRSAEMAPDSLPEHPGDSVAVRTRRAMSRTWTRLRRIAVAYFRGDAPDWVALAALVVSVPLISALTLVSTAWFPPTMLVLPILAGALLLRPSSLIVLYTCAAVAMVGESYALGPYNGGPERVSPGSLVVVLAVGVSGLILAQFRSRIGVPWRRGGSMLFDLRERLKVQSRIPVLPGGWHAEMALRPAGGQSFSGDFVVACRTGVGKRTLEAVLADVSGKGMDAGSRALLLSGAFGGLLGSLPPHDFLPAANGYLLRQGWDEGFASAVHLVLDLDTGEYELLSAGHLPGMQRSAGTGGWHTKEAEGPLLGILDEADGAKFEGVRGRMNHGDVLMLCTDGMVEAPGRDLAEGMDRLMGAADRLVGQAFAGSAWRLIETVAKDRNDDRALLLIWRE